MNYDRLRADLARPGYKPPAPPPPPLLLPIEECPIMVLQTHYCSLLYQPQTKILKVAIERAVADKVSLRHLFPARAYFDTHLGVENAAWSLDGVNLAGVDLTGAEFGGCSLRNANFKGANIIAVSFGNADLYGPDFSGATIRNSGFHTAKLEETHFGGIACDTHFHDFLVERKLVAASKEEFYTDTSVWKKYED